MATDTNGTDKVILERDARLLLDALRRCRRDVSIPVRDEHERNLLKRVDSGRARPCEQIVEIHYSAFRRGASRASVETFARALLGMIAEWYERDDQGVDFLQLVQDETEAEGAANVAEIALVHSPSGKVVADAADKLHAHLTQLERLVTVCDRQMFAEQSGNFRPAA